MRDLTLTDMERLGAFDEAERTFQMTEEAFRVFYELTARPVRVYLARMTGDDRLADDLLQETYYKFLRSNATFESDDHRAQLPVPHRHQPGPRPSAPAAASKWRPRRRCRSGGRAGRRATPRSAPPRASTCRGPWTT